MSIDRCNMMMLIEELLEWIFDVLVESADERFTNSIH